MKRKPWTLADDHSACDPDLRAMTGVRQIVATLKTPCEPSVDRRGVIVCYLAKKPFPE
jgi:hypothetical protein